MSYEQYLLFSVFCRVGAYMVNYKAHDYEQRDAPRKKSGYSFDRKSKPEIRFLAVSKARNKKKVFFLKSGSLLTGQNIYKWCQ